MIQVLRLCIVLYHLLSSVEFQLNLPFCLIPLQCHALISDGSLALCTASEQFNLIYLKNKLYEGEYSRLLLPVVYLKVQKSVHHCRKRQVQSTLRDGILTKNGIRFSECKVDCDLVVFLSLLAEEELIIPDPNKGKKALAAMLRLKSKRRFVLFLKI